MGKEYSEKMEEFAKRKKSDYLVSWLQSNKYFSTTPIAGMSLISNAKFHWERMVWYLLMITFASLTVYGVYGTVNEYLSEPKTTSVTLVDTTMDRTQMYISLEEVTIHFPLGNILLDRMVAGFDHATHNLTKDDMISIVTHPSLTYRYLHYHGFLTTSDPLILYLRQQFKQSVAKLKTKADLMTKPWDPFILHAILRFELDETIPYGYRGRYDRCESYFYKLGIEIDEVYCSLITMIDNLNVTVDEYYSKIYDELSAFYDINYYTATKDPDVKKVDEGKMDEVGSHMPIWRSIKCKIFGNDSTSCGISFFFQRHFNWTRELVLKTKYDRHHRYDYFSLTWYKELYLKNLTFLTEKFVQEKKEISFYNLKAKIGLTTDFQQKILEIFNATVECFEQATALDCRTICYQQQLLNDCGCIEQNMRSFDWLAGHPLCFTTTLLSNCSSKINEHFDYDFPIPYEPLAECEMFSNSLPTCFRRFSKYEMRDEFHDELTDMECPYYNPVDNYSYYDGNATNLTCDLTLTMTLHVDSYAEDAYVYKQYRMNYKISWSQFLSNLGGSFDLWIGISAISLVHLFVYITKQLFYLGFRKKAKTVLSNWQQIASVNGVRDALTNDDNSENKVKRLQEGLMNDQQKGTAIDNLSIQKEHEAEDEVLKLRQRVAQLEHQNEKVENGMTVLKAQYQEYLNEMITMKQRLAQLEDQNNNVDDA